jgi:hypothetical protein
MSTAGATSNVREAFVKSGSDWIFRFWGDETDKNLDKVRQDIDRFTREYKKRFGENPDPYHLLKVNPLKGAVFFQIDTFMVSVEMKIVIWRILLGCEIVKVHLSYESGKRFLFRITLRPPYGGQEETYIGKQPGDFRVLRHFGVSRVDDQLLLHGYFTSKHG